MAQNRKKWKKEKPPVCRVIPLTKWAMRKVLRL